MAKSRNSRGYKPRDNVHKAYNNKRYKEGLVRGANLGISHLGNIRAGYFGCTEEDERRDFLPPQLQPEYTALPNGVDISMEDADENGLSNADRQAREESDLVECLYEYATVLGRNKRHCECSTGQQREIEVYCIGWEGTSLVQHRWERIVWDTPC
ncbi:hypothetical protein BJ508DRAFT_329185 [Ascobolus immersus RN42]|uniref:Uncharacterized protein n=1 Tax=Ascobolus immersus RN42 TaxID=1160509 RepID=A0A3N4HZE3_ASCIM|nr:hypothetical protein BJ508DRAFT_329185 [Ascobolus immersus RN42]